jgi:endonuclease/exonuclease/phosphatase (EEP) superfamily protein YafD
VLTGALWIVVAVLAIVVAMRVFAWDDLELFAVLNCVTAFVYLPAWLVAAVALVARRPLLTGAALVVVAAQIVFLYPELSAAQSLPAWTSGAPTLRLMDANVYSKNPSMAGYVGEIREYRPQLVTMEEATTTDVIQLRSSGVLAELPYQIELKGYSPSAFFIASHYPLSGNNAVYLPNRPLIVQTTLDLPSGRQDLWVVHTVAPLPVSFAQWKAQLAEVARLIGIRGSSGLLVVGDFNATWGSRGFHQILDQGMIDGAAARGDAFGMTWSQMKPPLPPLVRIDHVLTGPGVEVTQIHTEDGPGSDHRDLVATVAFDRPHTTK